MGFSCRRQLFPFQEQSRSVEQRVSLYVQIPSRLPVSSLRARWHWTNLPHKFRTGFLEGRSSRIEPHFENMLMKKQSGFRPRGVLQLASNLGVSLLLYCTFAAAQPNSSD